jgi:phosphotransacetylase
MLPTKFRFILPSGFREEILKSAIQKQESPVWRPCLLTDRDEISSLNRGPSIDAFDQVSVHLAKRFQMRRILEIDQSETRIVSGSHVW